MVIYKITNNINNKIYIGKDSRNDLTYYGSGVFIKRAINKYSKENFTKEIICHCFFDCEMDDRERFYIKFYNSLSPSGYNLTSGGDGFSDPTGEIAKKISKKLKGRKWTEERKKLPRKPVSEETKVKHRKPRGPHSEEARQNMRTPHGPMPEETKQKLREKRFLQIITEESKKKRSETMIERGKSGELRKNHKIDCQCWWCKIVRRKEKKDANNKEI